MKKLFSTAAFHPRDRFDAWHSIACRYITDHASDPENRDKFHAEIEAGSLADIEIVSFKTSNMRVDRTPRHIARSGASALFVCRQVEGRTVIEQDSRELVLDAGDLTLLDPQVAYLGRFSRESKLIVLKVPRASIAARVGKTGELSALSLGPSAGEVSFISALIQLLPDHAGNLGSAAAAVIQEKALDLLALALSKRIYGHRPRPSSARSLVRMQLRAAIEARLMDPKLDAPAVAAAAGVSVRYANATLADEGMSIGRLIQTRRLSRCRAALEDPNLGYLSVSDIAYGWGFSDMTHFGRKFKATFGALPREFRKRAKDAAALQQGSGDRDSFAGE